MKVIMDFQLKDYRTIELAEMYGSPERSFRNWIRKHKDKIGKKEGQFWTTAQVLKILELRGPVCAKVVEEDEI